jgi:hypothetical protein
MDPSPGRPSIFPRKGPGGPGAHDQGKIDGKRPLPGGNGTAAGGGFPFDHIYLYGSRARGEAGPDSDYDLMLVVSASQLPRYRRNQQAFRALCGLGVPKQVIVLTREEFEAGRKVVCSLPATVLLPCCGRGNSFMQPEKLAEVRSWLNKAASDLRNSLEYRLLFHHHLPRPRPRLGQG